MAMHRWVKAAWSADQSDDEEAKLKFLSDDYSHWSRLRKRDEDLRPTSSRNKLMDLLGAEYLSLLKEMDHAAKCEAHDQTPKKNSQWSKRNSYDSGPSILEAGEDEVCRPSSSKNKLIGVLGAEYVSLLNDLEPDENRSVEKKIAKKSPQLAKRDTYISKAAGKESYTSKLLSKDSQSSKPPVLKKSDEVLDENKICAKHLNKNYKPYSKFRSIGSDVWGEDSWNDISKNVRSKRRLSAPILTINR